MPENDYPSTVLEVLDPGARYHPSALRAVQLFARSHPWRGSLEERMEKFRVLNRKLASAYGIREPDLRFESIDGGSSGGSHYLPALHRIVMTGKLSVVTFLHEFGHARGMNERGACRFSINLFRRFFPRSFSGLVHQGHMLIRPETICRVEPQSDQAASK